MSLRRRTGWRCSLQVKILAVLIPAMGAGFLLATLGLDRFLRDFFQRNAQSETAQLGRAIEAALRQAMLRRPALNLSDTLADVAGTPGVQRIWVIDKSGQVVHAADRGAIGRVFNKRRDVICSGCHAEQITPEALTIFTRNEAGTPILRHIRPIANEKACWSCHASKQRLNGVLLLEESTHGYEAALSNVQRRVGATGTFTLVLLALATIAATFVLVQKPVRRLIAGVRSLAAGDLSARVSVAGGDELAELADNFNKMAEDLGQNIEEVRNRNVELSVVYAIVERLTKTIDLNRLKKIALQTLMEVFDAEQVLLLSEVNSRPGREILMRKKGEDRLYRLGEGIPHAGFPSRVVELWVERKLTEPLVAPDSQSLAIPLHMSSRPLGLLVLLRDRPFHAPETNPRLLRTLADHVAISFANARLYSLAITDELTQLFTIRHFHFRIEQEILESAKNARQFALMMLDLDHFKAINDQWGHPAGDEVLRQVAGVILRTIRVGDSAYRYGGEEFVVLLTDADPEAAQEAAERVRQGIEQLPIIIDGRTICVTASVGIACYPHQGGSSKELVAAADAALYCAKRSGRNRVLLAPAPASEPTQETHA